MFKANRILVRHNKSSSYPGFELSGVYCILIDRRPDHTRCFAAQVADHRKFTFILVSIMVCVVNQIRPP